MAVYTNDLRLKEIATGDEAGTWGNSTNTNLQLIADAFGFGTEAITTNADTHTTTIADGSADAGRSIFLKYTGTLDSACTITIGPNTVSKLWFIENATSGSQNIIIKQGSGATVTIANGQTKAIYSDGAGSGGAMVDAFQDLSIPDLFIDDDLTFTSDSAVITFGADGDTTLTHTDGSGLTLNSTNKLMFNDASQFIQGSSATVLSLGATDEIDLTATAIDVNGTMDVSGALTGTTATLTTADNLTQLQLVSTDTDANAGPILDLFRSVGSSAADSDQTGSILFTGRNDAPETITYARINSFISDASDGTEDGLLHLKHIVAGTEVAALRLDATEYVFNDSSLDVNFRVESDGNTHMLFVDAGNDTVVIGSGSITAPSTVDFLSYASAAAGRSAFVHGSGDGGIVVSGTGSGSAASVIFGNNWGSDGSGFFEEYRLIMDGSDDSLQFKYDGNASTALTLSSAGVATFGGAVNTGGNLSVTGQGDFSTSVLVGTNNSTFSENNLRFLSSGDAFIDHSTTGQKFQFRPSVSSSLDRTALVVGGTEVVVNESSDDTDFRVESDSSTHQLFVDAGNNRVGVGLSSLTEVFEVYGSINSHYQSTNFNAGVARTFLDYVPSSSKGRIGVLNGADSSTETLAFVASTGTAQTEVFQITPTEFTVNEGSADIDFRVESDSVTHALFVDAGNGTVNINTSSGAKEGSAGGIQMQLGQSGATAAQIFFDGNGADRGYVIGSVTDDFIIFNETSAGVFKERLSISDTEVVFNQESQDMDFRVESDASANMLFVDSGNSRVFINSVAANISKFQSAQFAIGGNSAFRVFNLSGTSANDTGISVNAGNVGMAMLVIGSRNTGAGTATASGMYLLNFAYDGNNTPTSTHIAGTDFLSFGQSSGNDLTITNAGSGNCTAFLMMFG